MKINVVYHEYLEEEYSPSNDGEHFVSIPRNGVIDERKLVFGPIIFRGTFASLNYLRFNLKQAGWPNLIWPFNQDDSIFNYSFLSGKSLLLNEDFLLTKSNEYFNMRFPCWVRSNSGNKIFSGGVFKNREEYLKEIEYLKSKNIKNFDIVYAKPKEIMQEYRTVFVGNRYISGSQYMNCGEIETSNIVPAEIVAFASSWNNNFGYQFKGNYILDVCFTKDRKIKVVEVNSLLTSGLYSSNIQNVIAAIKTEIKKYESISSAQGT